MAIPEARPAKLATQRSLPALLCLLWRLKLARFLLWLARVTERYDGAHLRLADRLVSAIERRLWGE